MTRNKGGGSISDELATLRHIEQLVTVIAKALLCEKSAAIQKDPKRRMIYEEAGRVSAKDLAKKARVSLTTISELWREWERDGLLIKDGKSYRPIL